MNTIEYRFIIEKTDWGVGDWCSEPDKVQWLDQSSGLPCLALRSQFGSWCGYVGVLVGHPLHGKKYSDNVLLPAPLKMILALRNDWLLRIIADEDKFSPESFLDTHGGITFANTGSDLSKDQWTKTRKYMKSAKFLKEVKNHPVGDSARTLKEWGGCIDDYDAWVRTSHARSLCFVPDAGAPDNLWLFGFDCAHAGDLAPSMNALLRSIGSNMYHREDEIYRDLSYVKAECSKLAKQLAVIRDYK